MSFLRKLHCSSEGNDRENGHIALSCKRFIVSRVQPIRTHTLTRRCTYTFFIVSLHHQHHFCHIGDAIWKLHLSLLSLVYVATTFLSSVDLFPNRWSNQVENVRKLMMRVDDRSRFYAIAHETQVSPQLMLRVDSRQQSLRARRSLAM